LVASLSYLAAGVSCLTVHAIVLISNDLKVLADLGHLQRTAIFASLSEQSSYYAITDPWAPKRIWDF
jgi:hypothetical protein